MTERAAMRIILRYVHGKPVPYEQVYHAIGAMIAGYDRRAKRKACRAARR